MRSIRAYTLSHSTSRKVSEQPVEQSYVDREDRMIALIYAKDQLRNYVMLLPQIVATIKEKTGKVFVPVSIQNSPVGVAPGISSSSRSNATKKEESSREVGELAQTSSDIMILMRSTDSLDNFILDRGSSFEETRLSRSFALRNF